MVESIDKPKEITQSPPAATPEAASASEKTKPFVSIGDRIHNEFTYRGVDFLLNSTIGVAVTYWSAKTKHGQEWFAKPVTNFFKSALKPLLKNEKSLEEGAKWGGMFTSIIVGGTTIIPPMMVLEHPKVKTGIMRWLDEKFYGKQAVANDPKFEESYHKVANEPKQGFLIGWAARAAVLAPMIALTVSPLNKYAIKYFYDPIANGTKWTAKTIGIKPGKMLTEGELIHPQGNTSLPKTFQSNWDFLHETIGFDLGLTFIYSFCHEAAYKSIAALFHPKNKTVIQTDTTSPEAQTPASMTKIKNWTNSVPAKPSASFVDQINAPYMGKVLSV